MRLRVDLPLRWNQNGLRQARSTVTQIRALRCITDGMKAKQLYMAMVYIEFVCGMGSVFALHSPGRYIIKVTHACPRGGGVVVVVVFRFVWNCSLTVT